MWPTAAKNGVKWYRVVVEAADRFMVTWHEKEAGAERSWLF